jgi:hypothetical protein
LLLAIPLVAVAVIAAGSRGENVIRACAGRACSVGARLPAPITIAAGQGIGSVSYRIGRDRQIRHTARIVSGFPHDAAWFPATGTWFMFRHRHLLVGRAGTPAWRSRGQVAPNQVGVIIASSRMVAFQHDHNLNLAPLRGAERPVASREMPLGFTAGGLYTYSYPRRQLLLRSDTGAILKVIAPEPFRSEGYFVTNGSLYFIVHGVLMRALGPRVQRLASLAGFGMSGAWFQPVGRLLELQDNDRLVVLRPDGSVFASTPLPRNAGETESISSSLVVAPDTSAVAFAAAAGESNDPNAARRAHGTETVYLLRPGSHKATPIHTEHVVFRVCERGANLQWHDRWLLYSNSEGHIAAIDTTDAHHTIELGSLVRGLPGTRNGFSASWSGQPAGL